MEHDSFYNEELFLNHIRDLRERIALPTDDYRLLMSVIILRKLLYDSNPLIILLNRTYRLRLQFQLPIRTYPLEPLCDIPGSPQVFEDLPDISDHAYLADLDRFLGHVILNLNDKPWTVKDFIDYSAYYLGGIHHDRIQAHSKFEELQDWSECRSGIIGERTVLYETSFLYNIIMITIHGVQPLCDAIQNRKSRLSGST